MTRACRTLSVHMSALLPSPHDMQPCPQGAQAQATQGALCCQGALWGWLQGPCQEPTVCGLEPHHPTCTPKGPACSTYSGQGVCCQPQAPCGSQGTYSAVKVRTSADLCVASRWGVRPPKNLKNNRPSWGLRGICAPSLRRARCTMGICIISLRHVSSLLIDPVQSVGKNPHSADSTSTPTRPFRSTA